MSPTALWAHATLGLALLLQGKFEEAAAEAQKDAAEWARLYVEAAARWSQKRIPESDTALVALIKSYADTAPARSARSMHIEKRRTRRSSGWSERARSATRGWAACASSRSTRISTATRVGMHSCTKWAWPMTN
jgi:hypothetical protein